MLVECCELIYFTLRKSITFDLPVIQSSTHVRTGMGQWMGEGVATFTLLCVIWGSTRHNSAAAPYAIASVILGAYWFTSSTSFANPAVSLARSFTDTFSGIRQADVPAFVVAQGLGATAATALFTWFDANAKPDPSS